MSAFALKIIAFASLFVQNMLRSGLIDRIFHINQMPFAAMTWTVAIIDAVSCCTYSFLAYLLASKLRKGCNAGKLLLWLLAIAIVYQIPLNLIDRRSVWEVSRLNFFFTLLLGALAACGHKLAYKLKENGALERVFGMRVHPFVISGVCLAACVAAAKFLKTDYPVSGVVLVFVAYAFTCLEYRVLMMAFAFSINAAYLMLASVDSYLLVENSVLAALIFSTFARCVLPFALLWFYKGDDELREVKDMARLKAYGVAYPIQMALFAIVAAVVIQ